MSATYRLSFTAGSSHVAVSRQLAAHYLNQFDWNATYAACVEENWLQSRTANSSRRIASELIARLKELSRLELTILKDGPSEAAQLILWLAICRHYALIADFTAEVVRERFLVGDSTPLTLADFDLFYERKSALHPELSKVSPATRGKIRQKTFQFLQEAALLDSHRRVVPLMVPADLLARIPTSELAYLTVFVRGGV